MTMVTARATVSRTPASSLQGYLTSFSHPPRGRCWCNHHSTEEEAEAQSAKADSEGARALGCFWESTKAMVGPEGVREDLRGKVAMPGV